MVLLKEVFDISVEREKEERPLNSSQLRFIDEYILDPSDKAAAAVRAGYSPEAARDAANRLLNDPRVNKMLLRAQERALDTLGITASRVLQELWKVAGANPGDVIQVLEDGEIDVNPSKLIGEVTVTSISGGSRPKSRQVTSKTVKPADKVAALSQIAKILNMFPKQEVEIKQEISFADMVINSFPVDSLPILDTTATEVDPSEPTPSS